jgi:micrococcal nuclease
LAKRKTQPKYTIGSLLLLLAFCFYVGLKAIGDKEPAPRDSSVEKASKAKKTKEKKPLRYLTVFEGKVTGIKDGDTFEVLYDGQPEKVRLADIDCPEKSQAFGRNARQYASDLCFGKAVTVTSTGKRDRYSRIVGTVVTADGININKELVKAGFAWHYKQYSKNKELSGIEEKARTAKLGLWAGKNPTAPWQWRKERRNRNRNHGLPQ